MVVVVLLLLLLGRAVVVVGGVCALLQLCLWLHLEHAYLQTSPFWRNLLFTF